MSAITVYDFILSVPADTRYQRVNSKYDDEHVVFIRHSFRLIRTNPSFSFAMDSENDGIEFNRNLPAFRGIGSVETKNVNKGIILLILSVKLFDSEIGFIQTYFILSSQIIVQLSILSWTKLVEIYLNFSKS